MKDRKGKVKAWGILLGIITGCFAIALMILQNVGHFKQVTLEKEISEVDYLTHLLIKQEADVFSSLIFHNVKGEELQEKLDNFVKEELVLNASLYAVNGNLLAISQKQENTQKINLQKQDIVEPIYYRDNLEGFLRITLNRNYLPENQRRLEKTFLLLYAQEIILFLLGVVLTISIYYFINEIPKNSKKLASEIKESRKKPKTIPYLKNKKFNKRKYKR